MVFNCLLTMIRIWFNKAFLRNQSLSIPQCTSFWLACMRLGSAFMLKVVLIIKF